MYVYVYPSVCFQGVLWVIYDFILNLIIQTILCDGRFQNNWPLMLPIVLLPKTLPGLTQDTMFGEGRLIKVVNTLVFTLLGYNPVILTNACYKHNYHHDQGTEHIHHLLKFPHTFI